MQVKGRWAHWDGMTWPLVDDVEGEGGRASIEWILRYGKPSQSDLLVAASYIHAYGSLILATEKRRKEVVKNLKKAQSDAAVEPHPENCGDVECGFCRGKKKSSTESDPK